MPREENHPRLPHLSLIPDIDFLSRARIVITPARHMSLMLQGSLRTSCNRKHALSEPCCPSFAVSRIQLCRTRLRGVSMATRACTSPQGAAYWRRGGVWRVWIGGNHLTKAVKLIWICPFEHWLHQIKIKYCHHMWYLEMHRVEMTQFIQEHLAFHKSRVRGSQKKKQLHWTEINKKTALHWLQVKLWISNEKRLFTLWWVTTETATGLKVSG